MENITRIYGESYAKHYELYETWRKKKMDALNIFKKSLAKEDFEQYRNCSKMANKHFGICQAIATKHFNKTR